MPAVQPIEEEILEEKLKLLKEERCRFGAVFFSILIRTNFFDSVNFINNLNQYYKSYKICLDLLKDLESCQDPAQNKEIGIISIRLFGYYQDLMGNNLNILKEFVATMPKIQGNITQDLKALEKQLLTPCSKSLFSSLDSDGSHNNKGYYDYSKVKNNLNELQVNCQFIEALQKLNLVDRFNKRANKIKNILDKIIKVQDHKKRLDRLPAEIKVVLSFIQHLLDRQDKEKYLDYIREEKLLKNLPIIFSTISELKNADDNDLCTLKGMQTAQAEIYKASVAPTKKQHELRVVTATILTVLLTPLSLIWTIPWVQNRERETLIEKCVLDKADFEVYQKFRSSSKGSSSRPSVGFKVNTLFNNQGEFRKITDIKQEDGKVEIFMHSEQAARFDKWLKLSKSNKAPTFKDSRFFKVSKSKEKTTVDNNRNPRFV